MADATQSDSLPVVNGQHRNDRALTASVDPASIPLRNHKHERYARARSMLMPKVEAYRHAGFAGVDVGKYGATYHTLQGNASRLERGAKMQARIAFLCRQPDEILAAKRKRLEEALWVIHEANYSDLWEVVPAFDPDTGKNKVDHNGEPLYYERARFFRDLPDDLQRAMETVQITEDGRRIPKLYSRLTANTELRKLLGIGPANSSRSNEDEYARMSDHELAAELRRQAQEFGVDVDLTYRFRPTEGGE